MEEGMGPFRIVALVSILTVSPACIWPGGTGFIDIDKGVPYVAKAGEPIHVRI
jgi:hypothetical protein